MGLQYLHANDIAHRHLKPGNVLMSNQHSDIDKAWNDRPASCKLTDFGESKSTLVLTNTLLNKQPRRVNRGTPVYLASKILVPDIQLSIATVKDLQKGDTWAYGMTLFLVLNPDVMFPYKKELGEAGIHGESIMQELEGLLKKGELPVESLKYQHKHSTDGYNIHQMYEACAIFNAQDRPDISEVLTVLDDKPRLPTKDIHLRVSQTTAVEHHDYVFAENVNTGLLTEVVSPPSNNGTNARAFLAVMIGHKIHELSQHQQIEGDDGPVWSAICEEAQRVIIELPEKINPHRDIEQMCDILGAYAIMRKVDCGISEYEFSEELVTQFHVLSGPGTMALRNATSSMAKKELSIALYLCSPVVVLLGTIRGNLFLLDTHPVSHIIGGQQRGLLKAFPPADESVKQLCVWLWHRFQSSGIPNASSQLFSFMEQVPR